MTEEKKDIPSPGNNDEIEVYELCLILKKRFTLIACIFLSAVLITGIINFLIPPVYRSSFIVKAFTGTPESSPIISTDEMVKLISELDRLRKEQQLGELSKRLNIKNEQIRKVVKFNAVTPLDAKALVEITLDVYDRGIIPELKNGIIEYLNQNPYVNERITMWKVSNLQEKSEIQGKIREIDEFKNILITQIKKNRAMYLGFNPLQLDEEVINLKKRLRDLEDSIKLLRGFEITIEPEIPQTPIRPKKMFNISITGIASLFLGISIAFLIEWIDNKKNRAK